MIKNVHYAELPLRWGDDFFKLQPGETLPRSVSHWDDGIEKYLFAKLGPKEIELLPDEELPVTKESVPEEEKAVETPKKTTSSKK